jgi:hypothetical protein
MIDHFYVGEPNLTVSAWLRRRLVDGWVPVGEPLATMLEGRIAVEFTFELAPRHLYEVSPEAK